MKSSEHTATNPTHSALWVAGKTSRDRTKHSVTQTEGKSCALSRELGIDKIEIIQPKLLPFLDEIAWILASQVAAELLSKQAETYH